MKINEIVNSNKSDYLEEGIGESLYKLFARTVMVALGVPLGVVAGAGAALFTAPIGSLIAGPAVGNAAATATMALGAAIGAWLAQNLMTKEFQKGDYEQEQAYSVFINGRKVPGDNLNYEEAAKVIAQLAIKEHDPKTYYTIYDNRTKSVVWRYIINQDIDSKDTN